MKSPEIRPESFGNGHCPIFFLVIFQDGYQSSTHCQSRNHLECAHSALCLPGRESGYCSPGLEIFKITKRRNSPGIYFEKESYLNIIGFAGGKTQITGTQYHHPIGKIENLQHFFGILKKCLQLFIGSFQEERTSPTLLC